MGKTAPRRLKHSRSRDRLGFTLTEVVIAGAVLALFIVGSVSAMAQVNRWAAAARLRTLALAMVQQRIDAIMTTSWSVLSPTPTLLTAGTVTETKLPLDNDAFNNETGLSSAFTNLDVQVIDTRTTVITSLTTRTLRAVVTVNYTYRGRPYSVSMTTLRATDDF
jgi:type II secretory pathway pseudopilin PulG